VTPATNLAVALKLEGLLRADFPLGIGDLPRFFTELANFGHLFVGLWSGRAEP
jgi:hypothetical protein